MKKVILALIILAIIGTDAYSRPEYSILQTYGTKCSNCHINNNYGGQRNGPGFLARKDISLINPKSLGLQGLYDVVGEGNSFLDGKILWGLDFRYQNARWGQTGKLEATRVNDTVIMTPTLERKGMIMQLSPYLSVQPTSWVRIDGMYNAAWDIETKMRYKGQQPGHVSATFFIHEDAPSVRVGYFPPSIGVDYDDHTILVRTVADNGRSTSLIPTDYAEYGIELTYDKISWLSASLGLFDSKNMADIIINSSIPVTDHNTLSSVARVSFHPDLPWGFVGFCGASHLVNSQLKADNGIYFGSNYFTISSVFLNFGMSEKFSVITEYIHSEKQSIRAVDNMLLELTYQIMEPVNVYARFETSKTDLKMTGDSYKAVQYVFGSHIYLLPFIDLLPEYRVYDRDELTGYSSQWSFQVHVFY